MPRSRRDLPNNAVYAYWADLRFGTGHGGGKLYRRMGGVPPNRFCAFIWQDVLRVGTADTTDRLSFEMVLHENGDIVFQYLDVTAGDPWFDNGKYAGFGLEDRYGTVGLNYLYACPPMSGAVNDPQNRLSTGRAIRFSYVPSGLAQREALRRTPARPPTLVRGVLWLPRDMTDFGLEKSNRVPRPALVDITGRKVMDLQPGENDIRYLAPGVYFVREEVEPSDGTREDAEPGIQGSEDSRVCKVVIQR